MAQGLTKRKFMRLDWEYGRVTGKVHRARCGSLNFNITVKENCCILKAHGSCVQAKVSPWSDV